MSEFIERSKHPGMTRAVEDHIMGGALPSPPDRSPKGWRDPDGDDRGGEGSKEGYGFNYDPPNWAGHTEK